MGLLDDAIREHLELKRRLGADESEVARLEREAFGAKEDAAAAAAPEAEAPPVVAEPEPEPVVPEPEPEPVAVEQPTRQFTLEEMEDAAPEPEPEPEPAEAVERDELEETPDFLQETPEHDRLWFEQKPPKDFDF
ncbi:MAG TPA: hypothetical protein PKD63_10445 [Solirubrobacteraceae bacterium]|nr:hypothetical protein [Solirubrobacteraceae bacterium]